MTYLTATGHHKPGHRVLIKNLASRKVTGFPSNDRENFRYRNREWFGLCLFQRHIFILQ